MRCVLTNMMFFRTGMYVCLKNIHIYIYLYTYIYISTYCILVYYKWTRSLQKLQLGSFFAFKVLALGAVFSHDLRVESVSHKLFQLWNNYYSHLSVLLRVWISKRWHSGMICFHLDETHGLCIAHENMAAQPTTYVLQIALEWAAGREKHWLM